jgi:triacylglycerol lipase
MKIPALASLAALAFASLGFASGCAAEPSEESPAASEDAFTAAAPLGPEPQGDATRYPIVLAHGFLGGREGFAAWNNQVSDALAKDGHVVHRAAVPAFGTVRDRGKALAAEIDGVLAKTGAKKVNVVAHSMGGLDAREVVSGLGYGDRVASVTTISTPHRGSAVADVSLRFLPGEAGAALDAFGKLIERSRGEIEASVDIRGALTDLSEKQAPTFNASHPDDARVYYQSWAGVSSIFAIPNPADNAACDGKLLAHVTRQGRRADLMSPVVAGAAGFVGHGTQPNDGFVLVSSAKWGNFRGCVPADHADEIGVFANRSLDPHTGFDFVRFHRNVAFDLAKRGF